MEILAMWILFFYFLVNTMLCVNVCFNDNSTTLQYALSLGNMFLFLALLTVVQL